MPKKRHKNLSRTLAIELNSLTNPADTQPMSWKLVAIGGALLTAIIGWIMCVAVSVVGWLQIENQSFGSAMLLGTQQWLLAHGAPIHLSKTMISLIPLGLSITIIMVSFRIGAYTFIQADRAVDSPGTKVNSRILYVTAYYGSSYAIAVIITAICLSVPSTGKVSLGALILGALACFVGACYGARWNPFDLLPGWSRAIPRAVLASLLVIFFSAALLLSTALFFGKSRFVAIHNSVDPGIIGGIIFLLIQLAYLPNLLSWAASWVMGAGFTLGADSTVIPGQNSVGLLPSIPILGAVPPQGSDVQMLWWLTTGLVAGVVAAGIIVTARRRARFDETALVGGFSGIISAGVLVLICSFANGSLGTGKLASMGVPLLELFVFAAASMGLSGIVTGLVIGLMRGWHNRSENLVTDTSASAGEKSQESHLAEETIDLAYEAGEETVDIPNESAELATDIISNNEQTDQNLTQSTRKIDS